MRALVRYLVLGIILFGWLLGGIQPAHADDDLKAGTYTGAIHLDVHSLGSQNLPNYEGKVAITWIGEGKLELQIIDAKNGTVNIPYIPMDIFDFAYVDWSVLGRNCYASVGITAKSTFNGLVMGNTNFDPQKKSGEVRLIFPGLESHKIAYDTVQGCKLNSMSTAQLIAINEVSAQLGKIILWVTYFSDDFIRGDCAMEGWNGSGSVGNVSYFRSLNSCLWWASKEGGDEWRNK